MNSRVKIIKKRHFVQPNPNQQHQQLQTRQRPQQHGQQQQQQQQSNSSRYASTAENEDFFSPLDLWSWEEGREKGRRESCEESASKKVHLFLSYSLLPLSVCWNRTLGSIARREETCFPRCLLQLPIRVFCCAQSDHTCFGLETNFSK